MEFFEDKNQGSVDWTTIKKYREEGSSSGIYMALIEAHKLFDNLLVKQGYQGSDIYARIRSAHRQLTNLSQLVEAIETWERVVKTSNQKVSPVVAKKALAQYERAIYDLTSETDYRPPNPFDRIRSWINLNLIARPNYRRQITISFLVVVILILILDNTHFGQELIHWLVAILGQVVVWVLGVGVVIWLFLLILSGIINFFEERK